MNKALEASLRPWQFITLYLAAQCVALTLFLVLYFTLGAVAAAIAGVTIVIAGVFSAVASIESRGTQRPPTKYDVLAISLLAIGVITVGVVAAAEFESVTLPILIGGVFAAAVIVWHYVRRRSRG